MAALTQDPQKNKAEAQNADKGDAYARLTPELKKVIDANVEARAELLLGYKAALDGAQNGAPIVGARLDKLQQQFNDKEQSVFSRDVEKMVMRAAAERTKADNVKDSPADNQSKPILTTLADAAGTAGISTLRFMSNHRNVMDDFDAAYVERSEQWDSDNRDKLQGLNIDAFNNALMQQHVKDGLPKENTNINPDTKDAQGLLKDLLAKNNGVAVADVHVFDESYNFVGDNMKTLKEAGVKTIYAEMDHSVYQGLYDEMSAAELRSYAKTGYFVDESRHYDLAITTPDENARSYGREKSDHFVAAIINMYAAAKENGINVIGIDEKPIMDDALPDWRRIGITNAVWTDNIKNHRAAMQLKGLVTGEDAGKYVVIGGAGHFRMDGKADELLGIPTIAFTKGAKDASPAFERSSVPSDPDFLLPGGVDYLDIKKDLKVRKLDKVGNALLAVPLSSPAAIAAKAAGIGLKSYAKKYNDEIDADLDRIYTPEELSGAVPVTPPATPETKPTEEAKNR
ncbi:MAG: hypothetical protein ACK502_08690 [Alphaproteobacteria bacterium]